jgi:hypothetical protein
VRSSNLVLALITIPAVVAAFVVSWRGRAASLPLPEPTSPTTTAGGAALAALRSLGTCLLAGIIAGPLVAGLGGRLVMRVLAATSGDAAQGRTTDAEEVVGEITLGGTIAFLVFVGLAAGVFAAVGYLLLRRALPTTAGPAGLLLGVVLLGTIGIIDPLSSDNVDFTILEPTWLAVLLVVATGLLLGTTFTAVTAWLVARAPRWVVFVPALMLFVPPFAAAGLIYVGGCTLVRGRVAAALARPGPLQVARVVLGTVVVATGGLVVLNSVDIVG